MKKTLIPVTYLLVFACEMRPIFPINVLHSIVLLIPVHLSTNKSLLRPIKYVDQVEGEIEIGDLRV